MVANGDLGDVRIVNFQFAHGFHSAAVEADSPGTRWRVNPATAGPAMCWGIWAPTPSISRG